MDIKREHVIMIILFLLVMWVYFTWEKSEAFHVPMNWPYLPPKHWKNCGYTKWGQQFYTDSEMQYEPPVPAIVNYTDANYKFPKKSLEMLKHEYENKTPSQAIRESTANIVYQ